MLRFWKDRLALATIVTVLLFVADNFWHAVRLLKRDDAIDQAVQVLLLFSFVTALPILGVFLRRRGLRLGFAFLSLSLLGLLVYVGTRGMSNQGLDNNLLIFGWLSIGITWMLFGAYVTLCTILSLRLARPAA